MTFNSIKVFLFFLLLLNGCVRIPNCEYATVTQSCECSAFASEIIDDKNFRVNEKLNLAWWQEFHDSTLTGLIEEALQNSPTLMTAAKRWERAMQIALQTRAKLFPEIDLQGSYDWHHYAKEGILRAFAPTIPPIVNDINLNLAFSYELDIWGKYRDLFRAALGEANAAAAERMQAELILTTSIAYTYQELQFLLRKKELLLQRETNRRLVEGFRQKRQENALDAALQTLDAIGIKLEVSALLTNLDQQIQIHIHELKALAGMNQDRILNIELKEWRSFLVSIPDCLSLDLIARRPDLIAQKAHLEAKAKEIDAAKTDFYPNINLRALLGFESILWSQLFKPDNYNGALTPAIHLPIFTAGRLKAHLREKVAEFNEAVYAYNELILRAAQQVADSLTAISLLQKEIDIRSQSLEVALVQEEITEKRLRYALDNRMKLLDAQNQVIEMKLAIADLEYGKQLAGILLIRALGGGIHEA